MKISGVWGVSSTWVMFGIYLLIPLGLFWLMDRAGALRDTSLFAALLVGFAYPAILAGGFGGLKAPSGIDGVLKPIQALTDTVIKSVTKTAASNERAFEDFVVGKMINDDKIFNNLLQMSKNGGADVPALEKELINLEQANIADKPLLLEKKARFIYLHLSAIPDFAIKLTRNTELMKGGWFKSPIRKARIVCWSMTFIFTITFGMSVYLIYQPENSIGYFVWRLGKANNSEHDRGRARENLRLYLQDTNMGAITYKTLASSIRSPGLPIERVDLLLQLLLSARGETYHHLLLCSELIDDLRVDSVDARARVNQALIYLATLRDAQFKEKEKELSGWNPAKGDSVPNLEDWVDRWKAFFAKEMKITTK